MKSTVVKSIDGIKAVDYSHIFIDQKTFSAEKLFKYEPVKHTLGPKGEYEVCTAIQVNGATWRTSCQVHYNGAEMEEFPLQDTVHTYKTQHFKKIPEALQTRFVKEAVAIHFDRCNAVKNYIALQHQHSNLRLNQKKVISLTIFFLLLALTGHWFLSTKKRSSPPDTDTIKPQIFSYKCSPAKPCNFSPAKPGHQSKTFELVKASNLPRWLTFDPKRFYFSGQVPPDKSNHTYAFQIRITNRNANKRLLWVKLKIEKRFSVPPMPSFDNVHAGKAFDFQKIDEEYLLRKLTDSQKNRTGQN